jgi:exonuclease VII small subunit
VSLRAFEQDIKKLAKIIKRLDGRDASVEWEIKKFKTVRT